MLQNIIHNKKVPVEGTFLLRSVIYIYFFLDILAVTAQATLAMSATAATASAGKLSPVLGASVVSGAFFTAC